jgi:peptide/nickel transport system substrate-binding protein
MFRLRFQSFAFAALVFAGAAQAQDRALTVVSPWEITDLEPLETGYVFRRLGVSETLVEVEPDGTLSGGVAESWSIDPDGLTWRFKIRPGLRFHDGAPVTAAAAADSLQKVRAGAESLQALPIASIRAEGQELVIRTDRPFAPLASYLTDYAGVVLSPAAYGPDGKVVRMIATGYYRVVKIDGQKQMTLEAFPEYWGRKPVAAKLNYIAASQGETRAALAESGEPSRPTPPACAGGVAAARPRPAAPGRRRRQGAAGGSRLASRRRRASHAGGQELSGFHAGSVQPSGVPPDRDRAAGAVEGGGNRGGP